MKNKIKLFGIIALVAMTGLSFAACSDSNNGPTGQNPVTPGTPGGGGYENNENNGGPPPPPHDCPGITACANDTDTRLLAFFDEIQALCDEAKCFDFSAHRDAGFEVYRNVTRGRFIESGRLSHSDSGFGGLQLIRTPGNVSPNFACLSPEDHAAGRKAGLEMVEAIHN